MLSLHEALPIFLLGLARLEQLGDARQTAGDVTRLRRFASNTREHVARLDLGAILDRDHRTRRHDVATSLARILVEQGQARTQILLRAGRGAIFGAEALGGPRGFFGLLGERPAVRA